VLGDIATIYRASKKKVDINFFTEWVCRPKAAVIVYLLKDTRITPNQVTFLSVVVAAGACAMFIALPGWQGAVAGAATLHFSYLLDCADGMLSRQRGSSSVLGHLLDFLMDEIKAFMVFAAIAVRLWLYSGEYYYLLCGLAGLVALSSGIAITSFTRRPEYGAKQPTADGQPHEAKQRTGITGRAIEGFEFVARWLVHYPQYTWMCAIFDRMDVYFWAYGGVNVLYLGYMFLAVLVKLGRFESARK
jgi:phosphatidylglycerophosphate synthase